MNGQKKVDYKMAENMAHKYILECGYSTPPVNPTAIAEDLGLKVFSSRFDEKNKGVSGFYDFHENAIFVNQDEAMTRQIFTVAHELGHYLMHQEYVKSQDYKVLFRTPDFYNDPYESEADAFAAHLLVPESMLRKYYDIATISELSRLFGVSELVINKRVKFVYGR